MSTAAKPILLWAKVDHAYTWLARIDFAKSKIKSQQVKTALKFAKQLSKHSQKNCLKNCQKHCQKYCPKKSYFFENHPEIIKNNPLKHVLDARA